MARHNRSFNSRKLLTILLASVLLGVVAGSIANNYKQEQFKTPHCIELCANPEGSSAGYRGFPLRGERYYCNPDNTCFATTYSVVAGMQLNMFNVLIFVAGFSLIGLVVYWLSGLFIRNK